MLVVVRPNGNHKNRQTFPSAAQLSFVSHDALMQTIRLPLSNKRISIEFIQYDGLVPNLFGHFSLMFVSLSLHDNRDVYMQNCDDQIDNENQSHVEHANE